MITVQFDYSAICDLLDIPHTYITGMRLEVDSADVDESKMGAFAVMRVELLRPGRWWLTWRTPLLYPGTVRGTVSRSEPNQVV
jgi:hypothetical protein